jgi:hypothetical protein
MWANNRVENDRLPIRRRGRKQLKFKSDGSVQRFVGAHAAVYDTFNLQARSSAGSWSGLTRHLLSGQRQVETPARRPKRNRRWSFFIHV